LILAFNVAIFVAYIQDATTASTIILLYFIQSVLIGIQYFIRLLNLGKLDASNKSAGARASVAMFFLMHYGLFHVGYFVFLYVMLIDIPGVVEVDLMKWIVPVLFANMVLSTVSDIKRDNEEPKIAGFVMFQPYLRVIPMHLLIIFGFNSELSTFKWAFLLFVVLKTIADVIMHVIVNKTYREQRPNVTGGWI